MIKEYTSKQNRIDGQSEESQYIRLVNDIIINGSTESTRNGITKSIFGAVMHFSLENQTLPILTTKRVAWKTCLKELLWFVRGETDNTLLTEQGVHIWSANGTRNFLDDRGLSNNRVDDLGPIYGHQWRHFNAPYSGCDSDYTNKGVDQLQNIIDQLKDPEKRNSRRLVMSTWNPCQLDEMALPPCHVLVQFNVSHGTRLSCALYQRSGDVGLGVPFNITSYCLLTHLLAKHCGLDAYEFIYTLGNAHIYDDHIEPLHEQIQRIPYAFPTVHITEIRENIEEYLAIDFSIEDYKSHSQVVMKMHA